MEYKIKNGLFRHLLVGSEKLIAIRLFVNGWAVTDSLGNTKASIKKEGDTVVGGDWSATLRQEEPQTLRVAGVKEILLKHSSGKAYLCRQEKGCFLMEDGGKLYKEEGIENRNCTLNLPEGFTPMDAMVLFCIFRIANEDVAVV